MSATVRTAAIIRFGESRVVLVCYCGDCVRRQLARPALAGQGTILAEATAHEIIDLWIREWCPGAPRPYRPVSVQRRPRLRLVR